MITKDEETGVFTVTLRTGTGDIVRTGFHNRRDARYFESEALLGRGALEELPAPVNISVTFEELLDAFLEEKRIRIRETTYINYEVITRRFIRDAFGDRKIGEITPADVRKWQNRIMQLDYAPQYIRKIDSLLGMVFNYAMKLYGLPANPAILAGSIGEWKSEKGMNFWTREEYGRFRSNIWETGLGIAFDLLFWTGMRVGELLALMPEDFDSAGRTVTISKTYRRYHKQDRITPPKTHKSNRTIYLNDSLFREVADYIAQFNIQTGERIFTFSIDVLRDTMERGYKAAGLHKIKIHDLRHSHASMLMDMGVTPLLAAERLGHEKVETTLNIYSHLYPDRQAEVAAELEKLQ